MRELKSVYMRHISLSYWKMARQNESGDFDSDHPPTTTSFIFSNHICIVIEMLLNTSKCSVNFGQRLQPCDERIHYASFHEINTGKGSCLKNFAPTYLDQP